VWQLSRSGIDRNYDGDVAGYVSLFIPLRPSRGEHVRAYRDAGDKHRGNEAETVFGRLCRQTEGLECPA